MEKKIIFFVENGIPTEADLVEARKLGTSVFRNAQVAAEDRNTEPCDFVAGHIPENYAHLPTVSGAKQAAGTGELTAAELKKRAAELGLEIAGNASKAVLVAAIEAEEARLAEVAAAAAKENGSWSTNPGASA